MNRRTFFNYTKKNFMHKVVFDLLSRTIIYHLYVSFGRDCIRDGEKDHKTEKMLKKKFCQLAVIRVYLQKKEIDFSCCRHLDAIFVPLVFNEILYEVEREISRVFIVRWFCIVRSTFE